MFSPVRTFSTCAPARDSSPSRSVTTVSHRNVIRSLASARSCMILEARSASRRWMTVTLVANLVRKRASSSAESPPPTTAISWPRKKNPSHVAHVDNPWPSSRALRVQPQHERLRSGRHDDRVGPVGVLAHPDRERAGGEIHRRGLDGEVLGAEALGLVPEPHHQVRAHDPLGEAGVVLDVGGQHQLAAGLIGRGRRLALDDERREVGAGGVHGRGQARRTRSDDDDVAHAPGLTAVIWCCQLTSLPGRG